MQAYLHESLGKAGNSKNALHNLEIAYIPRLCKFQDCDIQAQRQADYYRLVWEVKQKLAKSWLIIDPDHYNSHNYTFMLTCIQENNFLQLPYRRCMQELHAEAKRRTC